MTMGSSIVTAAFTAMFGVVVLVVGQVILKFLIEPIQEQRKTIGEIAYNLTFLANVGGKLSQTKIEGERISSSADPLEATVTLRRLASQLRASLKTIPCYDKLAGIHCVPKRDAAMQASRELIGWSNEIWGGDEANQRRKKIAELLMIEI
jgi:hypothetical protein